MDGERETCASRRALLKGAPALAVVAAVAAETGIALANAADPIFAAIEKHRAAWIAFDDVCPLVDQVVARNEGRTITPEDRAIWKAAAERETELLAVLVATAPTTIAGLFAGLRHVSETASYVETDDFIATLLASPLAGGANV